MLEFFCSGWHRTSKQNLLARPQCSIRLQAKTDRKVYTQKRATHVTSSHTRHTTHNEWQRKFPSVENYDNGRLVDTETWTWTMCTFRCMTWFYRKENWTTKIHVLHRLHNAIQYPHSQWHLIPRKYVIIFTNRQIHGQIDYMDYFVCGWSSL